MAAFVQSALSFGSYTFPAAFMLTGRDQQTAIDEAKIPFRMGTSAPPGTMASKIVKVSGVLGGNGSVDSAGNYILTRDQAEAEANLMASALESGYQQLKIGASPARYIMAQKRKFTANPREATGQCVHDVEIEFLAQDPRWLSAATNAQDFGQGNTLNLTDNGSAVSFPVVTFHGPLINPYLKITPAGSSGYIQATATVSLVAGDVLVIDCDPRNRSNCALLNGAQRLDLFGTNGFTNTVGDQEFFPYMQPGSNSVTAGGSGGAGSGTDVSVSWQDAWLF